MSDYSTSPQDLLLANQQKGYVGIHIEQGVPVLDRDLNLLHDLITATLRSVITNYVGNGIAAGADGFAILALPSPQNSQNFQIADAGGKPGKILVGGIEVGIAATTTYAAQPGVPPLTTPSAAQPDPRADTVYLDVFFTEVDSTVDSDLGNSHDVGMETSVRLKPSWVVRVVEGVPVPAAPAGHVYYSLAQLRRPRGKDTIDATMITDLRQSRLTVADMELRLALVERLLIIPAFNASPNQFDLKIGAPGTKVTLFGNAFNLQPVSVRFGTAPAVIVGTPTSAQIVVAVPNIAPQAVAITVQTAGGTKTSVDTFQIVP
jgi:IPT/TIG domain